MNQQTNEKKNVVLDRPSSQLSYLDHFLKETGERGGDRTGSSSGDGGRDGSIGRNTSNNYNNSLAPDKVKSFNTR